MPRTDTERLDFLQKHLSGVTSKTGDDGTMFQLSGVPRQERFGAYAYWEGGFHSDLRQAIDALIDFPITKK